MEAISHWLSQNDALAKVRRRAWRVFATGWHLGLTSFGGPPVHFKIYQELFSLSQTLSGPASTKLLYCINLITEGLLPATLGFLLWSLPGALGMLGLSIGVSNIGETLPKAVYALLSGLNAAVVGIIALAAVELSQKAVTDKLTRILVFLGATAGMLYNALWYFPVLILWGGVATVVFDYHWLHPPVRYVMQIFQRRRTVNESEETVEIGGISETTSAASRNQHEPTSSLSRETASHDMSVDERNEPRVVPVARQLKISWKVGSLVIGIFVVSFIAIIVLRATVDSPPLLFSLFANLYLAGTLIFGGGPVVIPLLREYVVAEGWVEPRDFLIGLAVIQAFPGPNFNFAVVCAPAVSFSQT
ncbi:hypothetical protein F4808DRAFT_346580 [Astrocystis sublimbata]|nr:hypothetical protein F4808DRAFT_346580 [Astrocystis sublimbata]